MLMIEIDKVCNPKTGAELCPDMKDKNLRFEVVSEDEWEAKLNEIVQI